MKRRASICSRVSEIASLYIDGQLAFHDKQAFEVHLANCVHCQRYTDELREVIRLVSNKEPAPPLYLKSLVLRRIAAEGGRNVLSEAASFCRDLLLSFYRLERREVLIGLLSFPLSVLFFAAILSQMYIHLERLDSGERFLVYTIPTQEMPFAEIKLAGRPRSQMRDQASMPARINDRYLPEFADLAFQAGTDDSISVMTLVESNGQARIERVIEYPHNSALLKKLNDLLASVKFQPAVQRGKTVDSYLILVFSKINVLG